MVLTTGPNTVEAAALRVPVWRSDATDPTKASYGEAMKIAIVGTGISGLVAAHKLHPEHELVVSTVDDEPLDDEVLLDIIDGELRAA